MINRNNRLIAHLNGKNLFCIIILFMVNDVVLYIFSIVFLDDKCDPNVGIPNIIKMKEAGVDVIFGMPCSTGK